MAEVRRSRGGGRWLQRSQDPRSNTWRYYFAKLLLIIINTRLVPRYVLRSDAMIRWRKLSKPKNNVL